MTRHVNVSTLNGISLFFFSFLTKINKQIKKENVALKRHERGRGFDFDGSK